MSEIKSKLLKVALGEYGVKEVPGNLSNPQVENYFSWCNHPASYRDDTAWCSAFANWVASQAGQLPMSNKLNARSWLKVGVETKSPEPGDIVVLWRGSKTSWKGHVGFFIRQTKSYVYILGGNQSNQVCIRAYRKSRVLEYRSLDNEARFMGEESHY